MHIMSTKFPKTLVWKHDYDVKLLRHKQRTSNTNDHHMPLNETPHENFLRTPLPQRQTLFARTIWPITCLDTLSKFSKFRIGFRGRVNFVWPQSRNRATTNYCCNTGAQPGGHICSPPKSYSNFDIWRKFQIMKLKFCILIIFNKSFT